MQIKEYGSDFHYPSTLLKSINSEDLLKLEYFPDNQSLYYSGRCALYSLLEFGIKSKGWKKVYLPSFYCHEVDNFINDLGVVLTYYNFNPFDSNNIDFNHIEDSDQCVIVNVNFFGLNSADLTPLKNLIKIDDITHNLQFALKSNAHYCFASLRKELPVPVGGILFSNKNLELPIGTQYQENEIFALDKILAMRLKEQYLSGSSMVEKNQFREISERIEEKFPMVNKASALPEIAFYILKRLPINRILEKKQDNLKLALVNLKIDKRLLRINLNQTSDNAFGLVLEFNSNTKRENFKKYLIANNVYPAVLWPNQISDFDKEVESRLLFVHIDYRYNKKEIIEVVKIMNKYFINV